MIKDPYRVVVADDHATTRAVIRLSLEEDGFDVVAEATNGVDAVALTLEHRPDLCVIDIHMPGGDGLAAVRQITKEAPGTACVVLTVSDDPDDRLTAMSEGATAFLPKVWALEELGEVMRRVASGETIVRAEHGWRPPRRASGR